MSCRSATHAGARARLLTHVTSSVVVASFVLGMFTTSGVGATSPRAVSLVERDRGRTVSVAVGTRVTVVLHSTYWSFIPTGSAALVQVGKSATSPRLPGSPGGCAPGTGCGTVTAHFVALKSGLAHVTAIRATCGEALKCTPRQSQWTVAIRVS